MIESTDNQHLKAIRKLREKKHRAASELFVAEGEDLVLAGLEHGWAVDGLFYVEGAPAAVTAHAAAQECSEAALAGASTLGSGTRVIGVFRQQWAQPGGDLSVYLDGISDPGNIGTVLRSALAFADGPVILGPGCADPYSPKAVRASMGAIFARPPVRATLDQLSGTTVALDARASQELHDLQVSAPVVICIGAERAGLSMKAVAGAQVSARIAMSPDGPESVNAGVAASIALYVVGQRFQAQSEKETTK